MALIKCSECGHEVSDRATACPHCGIPIVKIVVCDECGMKIKDSDRVCPHCGCPNKYYEQKISSQNYHFQQSDKELSVFDNGPSGKSRGVAGLLAILLGGLGVHFFYVGKTGAGILNLLLSLLGWILLFIPPLVVWVLSLVQGILMLTSMTQEDFEEKYVYGSSFYPI